MCACFRAAALQEELQKKSSALGDAQTHVQRLEQEQSDIKTRLEKLIGEGNVQKSELEKKLQGLSMEHQKIKQERDTQAKELQKVKEALNKASAALKESETQLEKEKKGSTAALEEKVGSYGLGAGTVNLALSGLPTNTVRKQTSQSNNCVHVFRTCFILAAGTFMR